LKYKRLKRVVLASGNAKKILELEQLLAPLGISVVPQAQFDVEGVVENGLSFVENAIIKARHASRYCNLPAIADDSGIEVDALNGKPGIYSARYAGEPSSDAANNALLLEELKDVEEQHRTARFQCVLVYLRHFEDPTPIICQGTWEGRIMFEPAGENGFGYDPLFFVPEKGCRAAELSSEDKAVISHRGKAMRELLEEIRGQQ